MATSFYNGAFFGGEFFNAGGDTPVVVVKTGGKGDNKRRRIVKPTGLLDRKATPSIQERIEESAQLHTEAKIQAREQFLDLPVFQPIETMSQAEIDFEIGILLRRKIRTEEDEILLLMLMMA